MKNKKVGTLVALLTVAILVVSMTGFFAAMKVSDKFRNAVTGYFSAWNEDKNAGTTPGDSSIDGEKPDGIEQVYANVVDARQVLENLEQEVAIANAQDLHGFTALVEQIGGKQYLTFSNGIYKVSYKNAAVESEKEAACEVIISNGGVTKTFYWDYYMESGNIAKLCPIVGDYCKNERNQLVFSFLEQKSSKADTLRIVAGNTLMEYFVILPQAMLENVVTVNSYLDAGQAVIADLVSDGRYYYVSLPACDSSLAEEVYKMKSDSNLTYEITDSGIVMQCFVELGNGNFIGRIRGNITYSSRDVFRLSSPSFYLFAEDDYCDVDSMGISTPITEEQLYDARVTVTGDGGEKLLVRARQEVGLHNFNLENFKKDENGFWAYYENGVKKTMTGIDVSKWQGDIDWKKVKAAGVDYAIIRLGYRGTAPEGNCAMDPKYEDNIKGALETGLEVGVYYFTQALTEEEAIQEANIVIENLRGYDITFPVVYDTEYREGGRANDLSNRERTACAKAFCETILAAGYTPMIYSSTNWSILDIDLEQLPYDLWYAYYGTNLYYPYNFAMWQYTDSGRVSGISTDVDLNLCFIDYSKQ